jgi:hypothetical protein
MCPNKAKPRLEQTVRDQIKIVNLLKHSVIQITYWMEPTMQQSVHKSVFVMSFCVCHYKLKMLGFDKDVKGGKREYRCVL